MRTETKSHKARNTAFIVIGIILFAGINTFILSNAIVDFSKKNEQARIEQKEKEKAENEKEEKFISMIQEGTLKRTMVELDHYKEAKEDITFTPWTKEDKRLRVWEEGRKHSSYYRYLVEYTNSKDFIEKYYVVLTIKMDKSIKKPMYSYYEYQNDKYNPVLHLPSKKDK